MHSTASGRNGRRRRISAARGTGTRGLGRGAELGQKPSLEQLHFRLLKVRLRRNQPIAAVARDRLVGQRHQTAALDIVIDQRSSPQHDAQAAHGGVKSPSARCRREVRRESTTGPPFRWRETSDSSRSTTEVTWITARCDSRLRIRGGAEFSFRLGLQTGTSVSTPSKVQFGAGFLVDVLRMAISKSSSVRSTRRGDVSIVTRISGNWAANFSSRGSKILLANVGALLTDSVPVALRPGSCSVALARTLSAWLTRGA